jgi:adenylate kinase
MHLILLGPPGAGKGTQALHLAAATGLVHLATGDMFRDHLRRQTDLGRLAQTYMDRGALVPDDVTIRMLLQRLDQADAAAGSILDGFPRTLAQAHALDTALTGRQQRVDHVLLIDVSPQEVTARLSGRWTCPTDGAIYHQTHTPPRTPGQCDRCQTPLVQRDDDQPDAIAHRLQVYQEQTTPLIAHYQGAGILTRINGQQPPDAVRQELLNALNQPAPAGEPQ